MSSAGGGTPRGVPRGVWVTAGFFAVSGIIDLVASLIGAPSPIRFLQLWEIVGRSSLNVLIALGLWHRIALCRSVALIYCLGALATYGCALALAFAHVPFRFPASIVVQSAFEVPSCALLFPFLRSQQAALLFPRPLFGR